MIQVFHVIFNVPYSYFLPTKIKGKEVYLFIYYSTVFSFMLATIKNHGESII